MMMTKLKDSSQEDEKDDPPPVAVVTQRRKGDAVADLERRLRLLEQFGPPTTETATSKSADSLAPPAVKQQEDNVAAISESTTNPNSASKTGKNALLVS
jgi:hypothetical protein